MILFTNYTVNYHKKKLNFNSVNNIILKCVPHTLKLWNTLFKNIFKKLHYENNDISINGEYFSPLRFAHYILIFSNSPWWRIGKYTKVSGRSQHKCGIFKKNVKDYGDVRFISSTTILRLTKWKVTRTSNKKFRWISILY